MREDRRILGVTKSPARPEATVSHAEVANTIAARVDARAGVAEPQNRPPLPMSAPPPRPVAGAGAGARAPPTEPRSAVRGASRTEAGTTHHHEEDYECDDVSR